MARNYSSKIFAYGTRFGMSTNITTHFNYK